ncbi:DUF4865 family protein [Streptomyces sp. SP17BM10]|uniref:DUF4865 family protein n=1 Tax=Streptomyces sp. SP17BM10 TaxID=3002530 RepID=UPI002E7A6DC4|nr:DUF4865 family protein [Streptomyces sp. SP17BM10]MEE1787456.1 DUF4865 family protein [Streptomyces sp. SP17BM10]
MHAMQYEITLPADYDMGIIRKRVAERGHLLDGYRGLGLKAYLVRERGRDGSPVNQYAPFYLWRTAEGMNGFLWGPGFRGLCADFGRPVVRHWLGAGLARGPVPAGPAGPATATRRTVRLPETADPAEAVEQALADLPDHPALHTAAVAVDPSRWELLHLALWHGEVPDDAPGTRYRVLHLSRPELDRLPAGRHW